MLVFEPGIDPLAARLAVKERIAQAKALPNASKPPTMVSDRTLRTASEQKSSPTSWPARLLPPVDPPSGISPIVRITVSN